LTGERAGRVTSREIFYPLREQRHSVGADAVDGGGRQHRAGRQRETGPDPARSKTPSMYGCTSHGNREIPRTPAAESVAGRKGKSEDARP
jgi:hypothetical protein